jgi:hypothetical protein
VEADRVRREIGELERLQKQILWWRLGTGLFTAAVVIGCVGAINGSVQGLLRPGPRQEAFTTELSAGLQRDVLPSVQNLAGQAITEVRPEVEAEFNRLGERVPELAEASYQQITLLQENLPRRGEKIMGDTFGRMLAEREQKIKAMFPEATEENVKALTVNLSEVAQERAVAVNDKLFSRHMSAMESIVEDMEKIRLAEAASAPATAIAAANGGSAAEPTWEMAVAVLDVVRDDLKSLTTEQRAAAGAQSSAASAELPAKGPAKGKEATR